MMRSVRGGTIIAAVAVTVPVLAGCVSMRPSVVDPQAFLGERAVPTGIYGEAAQPTLIPFKDIRIEPAWLPPRLLPR